MELTAKEAVEFSKLIAGAVVTILEDKGIVVNNTPPKSQKTAYQKTEQLLYNYNNFKSVVAERQREIEEIKKFGVPQRSCSIVEYTPSSGGTVQGIRTVQEDVDRAVHTVQVSVEGTVQALALIDKCMAALKNDPYYDILVMLYFEGRTMEDIGMLLGCGVATVSRNRSRLVRELSIRLFPDQVVEEYMS